MKVCKICGEEKPLDDYHKARDNRDGKDSRCKACVKIGLAKWKKENREHVKQRDKDYRKEHKEDRTEYNKQWHKDHPGHKLEWERENRKKNPERYRNKTRRRRAKLAECETFYILPKELTRLYNSPCVTCGTTEGITMDHIVPVAKRGRHSIGNLQPMCGSCNSSKGDTLMVEFVCYNSVKED